MICPVRPGGRWGGDGVTILLVEQDMRQALAFAHRACALENGCAVLTGAAGDRLADERRKKAHLGL